MIKLYEAKDSKMQCLLCPNYCLLNEGKYGLCQTRKREGNEIVNPYTGIISSSGLDPIEKKPLYHFMPGSSIFSVGFYGCTLKCQFCQNYSISQYHPGFNENKISPDDLLKLLISQKMTSIAFTYSEPTLYYEWVYETASLCKKNNIKTVLVTNGYLNPEPAKSLFEVIDAANIDLKAGYDEFYRKYCFGKLEPVKQFIRQAYESRVHIELTTLVITDTNDSADEMNEIVDFISSISSDIPFHISRYHPAYKFDKPATPVDRIDKLVKLAKQKLNFVYGGNVNDYQDTFCKKCGEALIKRDFYNTKVLEIGKNGKCKNCGEDNYIVH